MTLGVLVGLLISWHEYVQLCHEVNAYDTQWSTSWLKVYTNDIGHQYTKPWLSHLVRVAIWSYEVQ